MTYLLINDYSKFKIALEEIKAYGCLRRVTHLAKLNDYRLESNQEKRERKKKNLPIKENSTMKLVKKM